MSASLPATGRLAGIDYGSVRVGVAICDAGRRWASPLDNHTRQGEQADARWIQRLVAAEQIVGFVVGLPVHMSGSESAKSLEARAYGDWLARVTGLPVAYFDERYTTAQADQILGAAELTKKQRQKRRDMLAAQILLTSYLETTRPQAAPQPLED